MKATTMIFTLTLAMLLLSACDDRDLASRDMQSAQADAAVVAAQKGRFQLIPSKDDYPAIVFDTATGCVEELLVQTVGPNTGDLIKAGLIAPQPECSSLQVVPPRLKNRKSDAP